MFHVALFVVAHPFIMPLHFSTQQGSSLLHFLVKYQASLFVVHGHAQPLIHTLVSQGAFFITHLVLELNEIMCLGSVSINSLKL